jgi:hypothetical protein
MTYLHSQLCFFVLLQNQMKQHTKTGRRRSASYTEHELPFKMDTSSAVNPTHEGSKGEVKGASVPSAHSKND